MKWKQIISPSQLHQGMIVAFTTTSDENENIIELWNEQFMVVRCVGNTNGNVEIHLQPRNESKVNMAYDPNKNDYAPTPEILVVYWNEIRGIYTPSM